MFLCILYFCVPSSVRLFLLQERQSVISYTFLFVLYHFIMPPPFWFFSIWLQLLSQPSSPVFPLFLHPLWISPTHVSSAACTDPLHMKLQRVLHVSLPVDLFNVMIFAIPFTGCFSLFNWLLVHGFELRSLEDEFQLFSCAATLLSVI